MQIIDLVWHHEHPDEPIRLVSELDERRFEVRKLEFFRSGRVGFASKLEASSDTALSWEPVPEISEIIRDPQFSGTLLGREEFEALWAAHGHR